IERFGLTTTYYRSRRHHCVHVTVQQAEAAAAKLQRQIDVLRGIQAQLTSNAEPAVLAPLLATAHELELRAHEVELAQMLEDVMVDTQKAVDDRNLEKTLMADLELHNKLESAIQAGQLAMLEAVLEEVKAANWSAGDPTLLQALELQKQLRLAQEAEQALQNAISQRDSGMLESAIVNASKVGLQEGLRVMMEADALLCCLHAEAAAKAKLLAVMDAAEAGNRAELQACLEDCILKDLGDAEEVKLAREKMAALEEEEARQAAHKLQCEQLMADIEALDLEHKLGALTEPEEAKYLQIMEAAVQLGLSDDLTVLKAKDEHESLSQIKADPLTTWMSYSRSQHMASGAKKKKKGHHKEGKLAKANSKKLKRSVTATVTAEAASTGVSELEWSPRPLRNPLMHIPNSQHALAQKALGCHRSLLVFMGDRPNTYPSTVAPTILEAGLSDPILANEIYLQLMRQLSSNPSAESTGYGWKMFCICAQVFHPSDDELKQMTESFVGAHTVEAEATEAESAQVGVSLGKRVALLAKSCLRSLKNASSGKVLPMQQIDRYRKML
ncbi:hypothetical protein CYMTET_9806, partial [Cymbomonas tetramitiformis]